VRVSTIGESITVVRVLVTESRGTRPAGADRPHSGPNFAKDVALSCTDARAGTGPANPLPLVAYLGTGSSVGEGQSIRGAAKKMPPWFADPHFGKFLNDRTWPSEHNTLVAWLDAEFRLATTRDLPTPRKFVQGGTFPTGHRLPLPKPFPVPATGVIDLIICISPPLHQRPLGNDRPRPAITPCPPYRPYVRAQSPITRKHAEDEFFRRPRPDDCVKAPKDDVPNNWLTATHPASRPTLQPGRRS